MTRNTPKFLRAHRDTTTEHAIPRLLSPQAKKASEEKLHANARRCSHYLSDMTASAPQTFLRFPYRPFILTLLKQLQTTPSDSQAARRASKPPTVYAAFQQHWSPDLKFSVLLVRLPHTQHLLQTLEMARDVHLVQRKKETTKTTNPDSISQCQHSRSPTKLSK